MEDGPSYVIVLVLAMTAGLSVGVGYIASRKGRSFLGWAAVGLFLGLIGLVLIMRMPEHKQGRIVESRM